MDALLRYINGAAMVAYLLHNFPRIFANHFFFAAAVKAQCSNGVCMRKQIFSPVNTRDVSVAQSWMDIVIIHM